MGFSCIGEFRMKCSETDQDVCLPNDVAFCTDQNIIDRAKLQVTQAQQSTCMFKKKAWYPLIADWDSYLQDPNAGLTSRRCLYLNSPQIFNSLLKSNEKYKDKI